MQTIIRVEKLAKTFITVKWWLCLGRRVPENPLFYVT